MEIDCNKKTTILLEVIKSLIDVIMVIIVILCQQGAKMWFHLKAVNHI